MKLLVLFAFVSAHILFTHSKIIPEYLPQFCPKSTPNYNECFVKSLNKLGPYLLKGVREINFPKLNPLSIPVFVVNRTLSDQVSIFAVIRDLQFSGFDTTIIKGFKFDHETKHGEIHLNVAALAASFEYELTGKLLGITLEQAGIFKGNASDIELLFKFRLKPIERLGVQYYTFDHFIAKSTIGNGNIKLASKDPAFQFASDLLANFFNEDPKRSIDAVQPIYEESVGVFYRSLADQVLSAIPAKELIPE